MIGVTGPDEGGLAAWWLTRLALWRAGARACRIRPSSRGPSTRLDGLVIGGGADVDPRLYTPEPDDTPLSFSKVITATGEERSEPGIFSRLISVLTLVLRLLTMSKTSSSNGDTARDALEMALLETAIEQDKPVLGICRGAQLINVHLGGTLHRDLRTFYEEMPQRRTVLPRKRILVEPDSRLADILDTTTCRVNALHRQAVDRLASPLRVVAKDAAGIVQAVEDPDHRYFLGVQWHPEFLPQVARQRRIFRGLVKAARGDG